jgi:hypothetical protein
MLTEEDTHSRKCDTVNLSFNTFFFVKKKEHIYNIIFFFVGKRSTKYKQATVW